MSLFDHWHRYVLRAIDRASKTALGAPSADAIAALVETSRGRVEIMLRDLRDAGFVVERKRRCRDWDLAPLYELTAAGLNRSPK